MLRSKLISGALGQALRAAPGLLESFSSAPAAEARTDKAKTEQRNCGRLGHRRFPGDEVIAGVLPVGAGIACVAGRVVEAEGAVAERDLLEVNRIAREVVLIQRVFEHRRRTAA